MTEKAPITGADYVAAARVYLGVKFGHQGRAVGERKRIDCIGLIACPMKDLGVKGIDRTDYDFRADGETLKRELKKQLIECYDRELIPGRVALFEDGTETIPHHIGIITDQPSGPGVIHASLIDRKVIEHRIDEKWRRRIMGVFRFPEIVE